MPTHIAGTPSAAASLAHGRGPAATSRSDRAADCPSGCTPVSIRSQANGCTNRDGAGQAASGKGRLEADDPAPYRPLLGRLPIGRIDGETLDAFYPDLRRCRARCDRQPRTDHHVAGEHDCTARCAPHALRAAQRLSSSSDTHGAQRRLHSRRPLAMDRHEPRATGESTTVLRTAGLGDS